MVSSELLLSQCSLDLFFDPLWRYLKSSNPQQGQLGLPFCFCFFENLQETTSESNTKQKLDNEPVESSLIFKGSEQRLQRQDCSEGRKKCHEEMTLQSNEGLCSEIITARIELLHNTYFKRERLILIICCYKLDLLFDIVILIKQFYCIPHQLRDSKYSGSIISQSCTPGQTYIPRIKPLGRYRN